MGTANSKSGIASSIASGAAWMIGFRLVERSLGLLSVVILARILLPEDFGIVAMATTVIALIEVFTMNDFAGALIRNTDATRADFDTAWTMEVLIALFAAVAVALLAVPASRYFGDSRLIPMLLVLAVYPLLDGFYNIGCVEFRRQLQFDKEFQLLITRKLSGVIVCIPLALLLRSPWAMVLGMLAGRMGALLASYLMHPFRPRWSLEAAGRIWAYSKWILVNNILAFLNARGAYLIIGRLGDARSLGLYSVANDLSNLPTSELAMPINRAVFPGYSTLQNDPERLKRAFLNVIAVVALLAIPAGLGVAVVAPTLVPLVLGAKWIDTIPLVQILAVAGSISAVHSSLESVYFAKGLTHVRAYITALQAAVMLPTMLWLTSQYGIIGAAYSVLATSIVVAIVNLWRASLVLGVRAGELISVLWRPIASAMAMAWIVLNEVGQWTGPHDNLNLGLHLGTQVLAGTASFALMIAILWYGARRPDGAESTLLAMAEGKFRSLRRRT